MTNSNLRQQLIDYITLLNIPGVGRGRFQKLVGKFGSPKAVLNSAISSLEQVSGISHKLASAIHNEQNLDRASETAARIVQLGWQVCFHGDEDYPPMLGNLPQTDIPPLLFCLGQPLDLTEKMIAIVGSRHATDGGKQFAYKIAYDLTNAGITVVSGMAEGVDSYAHQGALDAGGKTVAVWGNSLDIVYPSSNKKLAEDIKNKGTVVSEYFPGTRPDRVNFPQRNRIISGLSEGVVVVEAGLKSGALITANEAINQGREVFAVPGPPSSKVSVGANELIKKGARLLTSVDDIFAEIPRLKGNVVSKQFLKLPDMTEMEIKIINLFENGPLQVDNISRMTNLPVSELMQFLLALEMKGVLRELSGKRFVLVDTY